MAAVRTAIAAVLVSFCLGKPVLADWQYTHWGMTPEAMARASTGKAIVVPPNPGQTRAGLECLVDGTYQAGNQTFRLQGCFDKSRSLKMVALTIENPPPSQGAEVRGALISKYGEPTIVHSAHSLGWINSKADSVTFYDLGDVGINVIYQPPTGIARGL